MQATIHDFTEANIVLTITTKDRWAILSPENPNGQQLPDEKNGLRCLRFEEFLEKEQIEFIRVHGDYGYPEHAYILIDISEDNARALGKAFRQHTVLLPSGLVECESGLITPIIDVVVDPGLCEYYTELPDGTRFTCVLAD